MSLQEKQWSTPTTTTTTTTTKNRFFHGEQCASKIRTSQTHGIRIQI